MPRRLWSDEDISRLKGMAGQYPVEMIAKALGRGLEATYLKAHKQRISLRTKQKQGSLPNVDPSPAGVDLSE
jgi:hypothetical protein